MPDHEDKYVANLLFGFCIISAGVMILLYASTERVDPWYFWGLASSSLFYLGLYLILKAFVHKIKVDLTRNKKRRAKYDFTEEKETLE